MDKRNPPTPSAPGNIAPSGIASAVWAATSTILSSGINKTAAPAAAIEASAPAYKVVEGTLRAALARGNKAGASSIPVATRGRTLSLEASRTPIRSFSSARTSKGIAVFNEKPLFSNRVRRPSSEVCRV